MATTTTTRGRTPIPVLHVSSFSGPHSDNFTFTQHLPRNPILGLTASYTIREYYGHHARGTTQPFLIKRKGDLDEARCRLVAQSQLHGGVHVRALFVHFRV
jgi:hypothetical protein